MPITTSKIKTIFRKDSGLMNRSKLVPAMIPTAMAGREIRIMVEQSKVSDAEMVVLAKDISKKIEKELTYPGQIKVSVIRETRATEYAR